MENLKNVDQKKLAEAVKKGKTVVEFSAPWCPECRFLLPAWPLIEKDLSESGLNGLKMSFSSLQKHI